jgi:FKBP-type peptidyl-prolyl cis-trans isomerase SlyD
MATETVVGPEQIVSIEYELRDDGGKMLDETGGDEPLSYLHGSGQLVIGVEKALEGKSVGAEIEVVVPPEEGYGEHDPEKIFDVPRENFDFEVEVGQILQAQSANGESTPVQVKEVGEKSVSLDANHPLAGISLNFKIKVLEVREATPEEKNHGHSCCGCHSCDE